MAKRRNFMFSFALPAESSGEFLKAFAPFLEHAEGFECTTVESSSDTNETGKSRQTPSEVSQTISVTPPQSKAQHPFHSNTLSLKTEERSTLSEAQNIESKSEGQTKAPPRPGNPTTSQEARNRFRIDQRGVAPTAREILTEHFGGKESFHLSEAISLLKERGLSVNTAAPTLNGMKYKGQAEHLSSGLFRIPKPRPATNGNGVYTKG